jgi:hypothetical protein
VPNVPTDRSSCRITLLEGQGAADAAHGRLTRSLRCGAGAPFSAAASRPFRSAAHDHERVIGSRECPALRSRDDPRPAGRVKGAFGVAARCNAA